MKLTRYMYLTLALALALALAGCGDDGKKDAENKKKVETQLAKIPGYRNATVTVKGDALTIAGFTAEIPYPGVGLNRVTIEEVKAEGVDFDAQTKPGVVLIAKKTTYKNYRSATEMADAGMGGVTGVVENMEFGNLHMDAGALDKALSKQTPDMREVVAAAVTMKADSSAMKNYRLDLNMGFISGTISMEKASTGAFSLFGCKDMSLDNFKAVFLGSEMFSLGKWTIKTVSFPDIISPAMKLYGPDMNVEADPAAVETYEKDMADALKKNPIILQGMVMEDMKIRPMTNDPLTLKKVSVDFEFSQDKITLKKDVEGFVVPPSVYGKGFEGKALAAVYGKPIELSGAVDFEAVKEGAGGRVAVNALRVTEKNLGSLAFTLKSAFPESDKDVPAGPADPDTLKLNGLTLTLKDTGALDLAYGLGAEEAKRYDPNVSKESVRAEIIQGLTMAGSAGGAQQKIADAFIKFLNGSGTFSLSMAPSFPVTIDELQEVLSGSAEGLNLKVSAE